MLIELTAPPRAAEPLQPASINSKMPVIILMFLVSMIEI
jgi:hypothetical protein